MRPVTMYTNVWGEKHIDWMKKTLIRSLLWPKNNEHLKSATWFIYTRTQDEDQVREIAQTIGVKEIVIKYVPVGEHLNPKEMGLFMLESLFEVMKFSILNQSPMLMAPPDTIFSEGSLQTLLKLGRFGSTCVAVPHARVTTGILDSLTDEPMTGASLVGLLDQFPHKSWSSSEIDSAYQSTFIGGIAWERLSDKLTSVQHMLPTIYLANFKDDDVEFFKTPKENEPPVYGYWDHLWPTKLIEEQRQRMPGSSDAAMLLEITEAHANVPGLVQANPFEPDNFWRIHQKQRYSVHNQHNRQYNFIMRKD